MAINACGLQAAEANRAVLRYIAEDTACWGATPASGKTREMRIVNSSLTANKDTIVSNELRADRMIADVIEVSASSGGDINVEFSAGSLDDFLQAFVLGTWTRPMGFDSFSGTIVSMNDNAGTTEILITGGDYRDYFTVGRRLKTEGFTTPANNDYWQIASLSYSAPTTTIVTTGTTGVDEAGGQYAKVMDANDVIIMKNTAIRIGTGSAKTIDSNGGNAFASAVAAGQLKVGQKIYLSGLGYGTGSVTFTGLPVDEETLIISDGNKTVTFEFDSDGAYTRGRVGVTIGADASGTASNLQAAIMDQLRKGQFEVSASVSAGVVTIRNLRQEQGGSITENLTNATAVNFAGGSATSHGVFTLTGVADDVLTVAETIATNANAGSIPVTIKGSHLRNPGALGDLIRQSFSIETGFSDVNQYFVQTGMRVGSFEVTLTSGEIVGGSVAFEGKDTTTYQSTVLGNTATYDVLATTATPVLNATTNVGSLYKNGEELASAIQAIEIRGDASLRQQRAVGSKFPAGIGVGRFNLTGKFTSYFETLEMYDHFLNHDTISLGFDFLDNAGNYYFWTIPAIKITTDPIAPGGNDQDVLEEMEWVAIRDPILNTMFMIDRFSSLQPATS